MIPKAVLARAFNREMIPLTLRGIGVGSAIPGDLVESTESGEFDATTANLELVRDDPWVSVLSGIEVIEE